MQKVPASGLYQFQNSRASEYLGYDPHGDYFYTKVNAYGAEDCRVTPVGPGPSKTDESFVLLFADFGKKYLAIANGKLTGLNERTPECVWIIK